MTLPADIANRSLDAIGVPGTIGDLQEGTVVAGAALRNYGPALRQLLRACHWNFARRQAALTLLQDATGQTSQQQQSAGLPVTVGTGTVGMRPWVYEYQWPIDGVKARFLPVNLVPNPGSQIPGNISLPPNPIMTGLGATPVPARVIPTRFVVSQDTVPPQVGVSPSWQGNPLLDSVQGQGRGTQTVILSNQLGATLVYTALVTAPDEWDPLFQQAMVALLASYLAMPCIPDKKLALAIRGQQIASAKAALMQARISDGDEGWTSTDHTPDWIRVRSSGARGGSGYGDASLGVFGYGWDACGFPDGSAY